jgi:hypothetical protein
MPGFCVPFVAAVAALPPKGLPQNNKLDRPRLGGRPGRVPKGLRERMRLRAPLNG